MWCRIRLPFRSTRVLHLFWWGSCCLVFSFLCCVLCTIICLFVFLFFFACRFQFQSMSLTVPLVSSAPLLMLLSISYDHCEDRILIVFKHLFELLERYKHQFYSSCCTKVNIIRKSECHLGNSIIFNILS